MKIAVYSRKSKLTDRGESVRNQIELCKAYAISSLAASEDDIVVFEDEGFSGGTTSRPQFTQMMEDIATGAFDSLICYRLDRISRNVSDFSGILEKLNAIGTSFVSITERFDTSTPMGRAMVNIAAVFAQLERETTAERIRDNMRRLALTGRFIGSTPPLGFRSETISDGSGKKLHRLSPVTEDINFVEMIFDKYLELGSLSKLAIWLENTGGQLRGVSSLRRTLSNPVYVRADTDVCEYYSGCGAKVVGAEYVDGIHGMLIYGRHDRNGAYSPEKWTVVAAEHEGIIPAQRWLTVQRLLEMNKHKAPRAGTGKKALLASKLRCGNCGAAMVVTYGGNPDCRYYKCRNKIHSRGKRCNIPNVHGTDADAAVFAFIIGFPYDSAQAAKLLRLKRPPKPKNAELLEEKERAIRNLMARLRENADSAAAKYIIADIERLDSELAELKNTRLNTPGVNWDIITEFAEKRAFIDGLTEKIIWDGRGFYVEWK